MESDDLSAGMTAFIDILGFSERVLAAKHIDDVRDIKKCIKRIQDNFEFSKNHDLISAVHGLNEKKYWPFLIAWLSIFLWSLNQLNMAVPLIQL